MWDERLMFRTAAAGNLTGDEYSTAVDAGGPDSPWTGNKFSVHVPAVAAGTELAIVIQVAPDSGGSPGSWQSVAWFNPVTVPGMFYQQLSHRFQWRRLHFITAGSSPNFGAVTAGFEASVRFYPH